MVRQKVKKNIEQKKCSEQKWNKKKQITSPVQEFEEISTIFKIEAPNYGSNGTIKYNKKKKRMRTIQTKEDGSDHLSCVDDKKESKSSIENLHAICVRETAFARPKGLMSGPNNP